ncbi:hypothetical protein [Halomonas piscis]|uniref:hypothetical protein n=1 Tax=Halomonas piscis TaxID=3031727 RepID=UPI0028971F85|nr:hypothetical protein [Halomonas piscis]
MSDEEYYLKATNEVDNEEQIPAQWAKALALAEGDLAKAKYKYIQLRVDDLKKSEIIDSDTATDSINIPIAPNKVDADKPSKSDTIPVNIQSPERGFTWWQVWAWLGLTLGNLTLVPLFQEPGLASFALILIAGNSVLMIMILSFSKYAFLIATILSLNPILWVINGIYLKNRWNHPKINGGEVENFSEISKSAKGHQGTCQQCGAKITINYGDAYKTLCKQCV